MGSFAEGEQQELAAHLRGRDAYDGFLHYHVLSLLARGYPIPIQALAERLGWPQAQVEERLAQVPDLEQESDGRIVGWGLTLLRTSHQLHLYGKPLFTWCALDTLLYPVILNLQAYSESRCPRTGYSIRFLICPHQVSEIHPEQAVISLILPKGREFWSRAWFCEQSHFFASPTAASAWQASNPSGMILSLKDAAALARQVVCQSPRRVLYQSRQRTATSRCARPLGPGIPISREVRD